MKIKYLRKIVFSQQKPHLITSIEFICAKEFHLFIFGAQQSENTKELNEFNGIALNDKTLATISLQMCV